VKHAAIKPLLLSTLAVSLCAAAHAGDAPQFSAQRLSDEVKTLSSDAFEGRGPATPAEARTIDYVVEQFKQAGLQPGGDPDADGKRAWTQAVPLLRAQIKGTPQASIDRADGSQALTQGNEIALRAPLDGAKQVDIEHAPLVFAGYGVTAPERHWDDFKGMDLHGKVVLVLVNDPDFETGHGDFGGKAMTYYGRWTYKYEEAARRGAAGLLVIHETAPASYGWATVKNSNTNTQFDIVRADPHAEHPPLEGWITRDLAADLLKRAGYDFDTLKRQAQGRDFQPVELKGETFTTRFDVDSQVITSHNIAGLIEGSTHPDQTVIYTAHWDHLGIGAPDAKGDRIYNGAVDNASGTAALIELARAFGHGPRPQRSILFLNVTAEEKGLLGSEYYADKPLYPLATTVGVLNMDGFDPHGAARNFTISGNAKLGLLDDLVADGKRMGLAYTPDPKPEAGHFFRSDHFSFAKRGVPAISYGSGDDKVDGGLAAGEKIDADYTRDNYHQPSDEWHADWSFAGMQRDLQLLYTVGDALANSGAWPDWAPDSEFRAAREASAAQRR